MFFCLLLQHSVLGAIRVENRDTTHWQIVPSLKYDFLCMLNTLSDDSYYLKYYEAEYHTINAHFQIPADVKESLNHLKGKIKDENHSIISAYLCLVYSASGAETLAELLQVTKEPGSLREAFSRSSYYSEKKWALFESVRPDLIVVMEFFNEKNFEAYYRRTYLPNVDQKIAEIQAEIGKYNVVPVIENHLGYALASDTITAFMLHFSQPHVIKIIGTKYLTDLHWPFSVVFRNAIHEMLHPPYRKKNRIKKIIDRLSKDTLWTAAFNSRNPSNGYNSYAGLFEEDAVEALENHLNMKFGMGREAKEYWRTHDGGIHVMAQCLFNAIRDWNFSRRKNYTRFLYYFDRQVQRKGGLSGFYDL